MNDCNKDALSPYTNVKINKNIVDPKVATRAPQPSQTLTDSKEQDSPRSTWDDSNTQTQGKQQQGQRVPCAAPKIKERHYTHTTHQKHHINHNPWIMRQTWKDNKGFISNNYNTQWGAMLNYTVFLLLTTSKLATSLKTKGINIKPLWVIPHIPTLGVRVLP